MFYEKSANSSCKLVTLHILKVAGDFGQSYREKYRMRMIGNLNEIKNKGTNYFIENQE